MVKAHQKLF